MLSGFEGLKFCSSSQIYVRELRAKGATSQAETLIMSVGVSLAYGLELGLGFSGHRVETHELEVLSKSQYKRRVIGMAVITHQSIHTGHTSKTYSTTIMFHQPLAAGELEVRDTHVLGDNSWWVSMNGMSGEGRRCKRLVVDMRRNLKNLDLVLRIPKTSLPTSIQVSGEICKDRSSHVDLWSYKFRCEVWKAVCRPDWRADGEIPHVDCMHHLPDGMLELCWGLSL